jgi:hypothetical protein
VSWRTATTTQAAFDEYEEPCCFTFELVCQPAGAIPPDVGFAVEIGSAMSWRWSPLIGIEGGKELGRTVAAKPAPQPTPTAKRIFPRHFCAVSRETKPCATIGPSFTSQCIDGSFLDDTATAAKPLASAAPTIRFSSGIPTNQQFHPAAF